MSEPNRAAEMAVFVRIIETGGFSGAARGLGLTPSAVSKLVGRLEARLGTRLLHRSTRKLALTPEGEAFHRRAQSILAEIDEAEREAGGARLPIGRIRVSSSASYVTHRLARILPDFLDRYPGIMLDIVQTDALSDLVTDRTDVAIRAGPLADSSLIARSLGETPLVFVAAPTWVEQNGALPTLAELDAHGLIGFGYRRTGWAWASQSNEAMERITVSDGEGIRQLAVAGVAPARLAAFTVAADLAAGRLVLLLVGEMGDASEAFHAVYVGTSNMLPQRVRVLLDHLSEHGKVG